MDTLVGDLAEAATAVRRPRPFGLPVVWSGAMLLVLSFLILYPVAMLLIGALTGGGPGVGSAAPI